MLKEALVLLGFSTPFVYAAATYLLFHFVDNRASTQAKEAISAWINSTQISKQKSSAVAVEIFDRIYTTPLWGWRAITRSLLFTTIVTLLGVWHIYSAMYWLAFAVPTSLQIQWFQRLACNLAADYLALYLIRRWLIFGGDRPFIAALTGPLIGVAVLFVFYTATDVLRFSIETWTFRPIYFVQGGLHWIRTAIGMKFPGGGSAEALLIPALVVHLWLPLFVVGVLIAQLVNYFFKASSWMQWFLKQGRRHPLDAVGYIAAIIVFIVTALLQLVGH
jgi:hypothetical protein